MQTVFFLPKALCIMGIAVNWLFVWANRWLIVKEAASVPPADYLTVCACLPLYKQLSHITQTSQVSLCLSGQATIPGGIPEAADWKAWEII